MKKNWFSILFLVIFVFSLLSSFLPDFTFNDNVVDEGYYIFGYDIVVDVNLNNSYSITETIDVHFNDITTYGASHGIYRYLATTVTSYRDEVGGIDAKKYGININNVVVQNDAGVSRNYDVEYNGGYCIISSLDEDLVNNTDQTYVFTYDYYVGYDRISSYDDFYYNLIGTQWDTYIQNVTFTINFPTNFEGDILTNGNLLMYVGEFGNNEQTELADFSISVLNKTITGSFASLDAFNGITMKLNLPNNYFSAVNLTVFSNVWDIVLISVSIILIVIALWFAINKSNENMVVETVQFYAPDNLNPSELKYILDGVLSSKDLTALIIYWASKGFLKIIIDENKKISLEKIKDLESHKKYESNMFKKLFKKADLVKLDEMYNVLSDEVFQAIPQVKASVGTRIESKSISTTIGLSVLSILPLLLTYILYFVRFNFTFNIIIFPLISLIATYILFLTLNIINNLYVNKKFRVISIVLSIALFAASTLIAFLNFDLSIDYYGIIFVINSLVYFSGLFIKNIMCYKKEISKKIGRIRGFKNFIITAEESRMKMLLDENPEYYYNVLPFAYVMGITEQFAKKFENLAVTSPSWYVNADGQLFSIWLLNAQLNSAFSILNQNMIKIKTNNAGNLGSGGWHGGFGGGFGSGGFSGGGFGGGGGGRG